MSQVCERAAHSQFFFISRPKWKNSKLQSGNRRFHSTETALLYFTDEKLKNVDDKNVSVIVFLDMSKAFDNMRHDMMLSKLQSFFCLLRATGLEAVLHNKAKLLMWPIPCLTPLLDCGRTTRLNCRTSSISTVCKWSVTRIEAWGCGEP